MTRPAVFTARDVSKALKGAKDAGLAIELMEIEIGKGGNILLRPAASLATAPSTNPWDEVLKK